MAKNIVIIAALTTVFTVVGVGAAVSAIRQNTAMQFQDGNFDIACAPLKQGGYICRADFHTHCASWPQGDGVFDLTCDANPLDRMERQ